MAAYNGRVLLTIIANQFTPNTVSGRQSIDEILDKTTLVEDQAGEYSGQRKEIRPITISTCQTMTYRTRGTKKHGGQATPAEFPHFIL